MARRVRPALAAVGEPSAVPFAARTAVGALGTAREAALPPDRLPVKRSRVTTTAASVIAPAMASTGAGSAGTTFPCSHEATTARTGRRLAAGSLAGTPLLVPTGAI